ncbi:cinnamoyl-CoA reductase 1-like [Solanum dulcamara]|uniref:cinnamoyl-CoA reductase 1-like n=1 Tax=Solanum dulcamara TaxID=45834 RepID=UPI0024864956|nr:cinnamoyl-CoA reductase 1-like [Solanum dulcamara]
MAPTSLCCISNTVCVINASTPFSSSLIIRLLEKGFTVHAAIQNHGDEGELMSIRDKKRLEIFYLDLFDYHSIIDALKGCSCLFYSFEPPMDHSTTYDEYMAEIEVRAAHNVLEACAQIDTIEKVVFTSSATSIIWGFDDQKSSSNVDLDEKHWSDINFCRKYKLWYALSKTLSEKTAWALAMDRGINMVSINSGLLMDPNLNIKNPYLKGAKEMYENGVFVTVDVDYLVDAHICVYEDVSSYGRYLCFNHIINTIDDAINLANKLSPLPSNSPPSFEKDTKIIQQRISNKKLNMILEDHQRKSFWKIKKIDEGKIGI